MMTKHYITVNMENTNEPESCPVLSTSHNYPQKAACTVSANKL